MKTTQLIAPLLVGAALQAQASDICPKGYGTLNPGEPCIPVSLRNYLYCLSKSGNGKIEVTQKSGSSSKDKTEISLNGRGSGVIVSGGAGGKYKQEEVERATKEIQEKLDPSLASNCKTLASTQEKKEEAGRKQHRPGYSNQSNLSQDESRRIKTEQISLEIKSVDFILGTPELTDRSLAYLAALSKKFSVIPSARITLIPEYRSQFQYDQDRLIENIEKSIRYRRQVAVRNALGASGFPSDEIFFEQGSASFTNHDIRFDNAGRRIESGIMVQAWP